MLDRVTTISITAESPLTTALGRRRALFAVLVASAMAALVGVQLIVAWIVMRILDELSQREIMQAKDMQRNL